MLAINYNVKFLNTGSELAINYNVKFLNTGNEKQKWSEHAVFIRD